MCASNPYPRELPKTQTTSPLAARFQCFSPRWSAFWVPRSSGRPLDGGNCTTRGCDTPATRRLRASCSAKPPPATVVERTCGSGRPRPSAHEREKPSNRTQGRPTSGTKLSQHTPSHRMCGTKLSQHTPSHRMCGTKLSQHEPHGPTSGRKLSLFTRNGSIWRFFYMQGEFCTVVTAKKLSRENFVPNVRQSWGSPTGHQARQVWRVPEGPVWRARAGFEAQSLAAVPVDNGAWPQYPQTTGVPSPSKFRMQFPHDTNRCTLKNRRISTIRLQHLKYTEGNCMRNWWESGPWGNKQHHADGLARSAAGQRPESGPWGLKQRHAGGLARSAAGQRPVSGRSALGQRPVSGRSAAREWPVGPQAASRRRACPLSTRSAPAQHPLSGWRAARPCHGLGYSPGAPRRPNRTRREWTRGRSTGRRAPWPRSCRVP